MATPFLVEKVATYTGHKDCIYALCKHDNPAIFFSSGSDGMVVQWDMREPDAGTLIAKVQQSVYALSYEPNRNSLLIGQNFEGVHRIHLETKALSQSLKITDSAIYDLLCVEDAIYVATGSGEVIVLDTETLQVKNVLKFSHKSARCFQHIPEMNALAVGYSDGFIRLIYVPDNKLMHEINAHKLSVFALQYLSETGILYSGSRDAHLKAWDVKRLPLEPLIDVPAHMYAINAIVPSPDRRYLASASMDKSIKLWDTQNLNLLKVINKSRDAGHGTSINKLYWGTYNDYLVSASDDRTLSLWHIQEKSA